jgi:hypothetical protein
VKWKTTDFDTYAAARDYIDTAIIPLIPITWEREMKSLISMGEYTATISEELERQLVGRIFLFPSFTYLKSESKDIRTERLLQWKNDIQKELKYVFFLTSDPTWSGADDSIILVPSIPLENMELKYKKEIISEQMNSLLKIVTKKWQESV